MEHALICTQQLELLAMHCARSCCYVACAVADSCNADCLADLEVFVHHFVPSAQAVRHAHHSCLDLECRLHF
jgi:hypothetical protein